jgi:alpha-beta hydrolase superfamily lysophospholipase
VSAGLGEVTEERIDGSAGELFVRGWRPPGPPRAVLAVCPGFRSHAGHYAWVGGQLATQGIAVYAVDLRGRGRSAGARSYVEDFADYVDDLGRLVAHVAAQHPGVPRFLLGHSAGGVVACLYALAHPAALQGLVCESVAFRVPAPDVALAVIKGVSHFVPHAHALTLNPQDFSRDPAVVEAMRADPLIADESEPFATVAALVRADELVAGAFARITLPLLIVHGEADRAAKPEGSRRLHAEAGSTDKTLRLYPGRFHDPLNDVGRDEVLADLGRWLVERSGG